MPNLLLAAALTVTAASAQIIVDTDSGFFGDDGVALTMLLRSPRRSDVIGITVVSGNVWAREGAAFMSRTASLLGTPRLPVLIGAEFPLAHTTVSRRAEPAVAYAGALDLPLPPPAAPSGGPGIDFLIRAIEAAPNHLTILALGPLTNIATVLSRRPDLATRISALIIMGGTIEAPGNAGSNSEFNFWFDPEAARAVLRSAIPRKILVPLDVCRKVQITRALFDQIAAARTAIADLYREDFGNRYPGFLKNPAGGSALWDELAAACLIDPTLIRQSESRFLDVDTTRGPHYGALVPAAKSAPATTPVTVITDMDFPRILTLYRTALTAR